MYFYVTVPAIAFIVYKLYQKWSCGMCTSDARMTGKVVIVTGANTGIGFETAKDLARRGARIILACRDEGRGTTAMHKIIETTQNKNVVFKQLDLASLKSVRAFAEDVIRTEPAIHVLVNNAGTGKLDNSLTEDSLPIEAQINHFGPFLLTTLLLPLIKASAPSRIVNVSSLLHKVGKVDPESFHKPAKNSIQHMRVYSNTKLANMLFTRKLSRDLEGSGVTVNCLHPGAVSTDIFRDKYAISRFFIKLLFKTSFEGAQTSIYLAVAPELENVSGKYFVDCQEAVPSKSAVDDKLADELWELSERVVANSEPKKNI
ncbi:hypothetical protein ABMA28_008210 [Loxostege sticticalis]|uniref:Uncharacterized protein n=1 Tax=Loxostege sticticalis TaxID=481309 RepID=A0ABD0SIK8_LOXSC